VARSEGVRATLDVLRGRTAAVWATVGDEVVRLAPAAAADVHLSDVRRAALQAVHAAFDGQDVLGPYPVGGAFASWWQKHLYDLKAIRARGWVHTLVTDEEIDGAFFQPEHEQLGRLRATVEAREAELDAALADLDLGEDDDDAAEDGEADAALSLADAKRELRAQRDAVELGAGAAASAEWQRLDAAYRRLAAAENALKNAKADVKAAEAMLARKRALKRFGLAGVLADLDAEIAAVRGFLAGPPEALPPRKGRQPKDPYAPFHAILDGLIARRKAEEAVAAEVGGALTEAEVRQLVLARLHGSLAGEVRRYALAQRDALTAALIRLWEKYRVSLRDVAAAREEALATLDEMLAALDFQPVLA